MLMLGCATAAEAAPVIEFELDGTASNNSQATAQLIPPNAFTLPVPATVFDPPGFRTAALFGRGGGSDIDLFRISGHGQLLLDVDNDVISSSFDTTLYLFNSSGVLLAVNDDALADDGSLSSHDSRILFNLPGPGVYFVGVTRFHNSGCETPHPSCNIDHWFISNGPQPEESQAYLLYLSLEHPHRVSLPLPPTLALLVSSGGVALGAQLWRRRTR
jgi:hypothetical protein